MQNSPLAKAGDTTPEAFSRQVLRGTLFKSLQTNVNLPLSCLDPLSNILKINNGGGMFPIIEMFVVFRIGHAISNE